MLYYRYPSKTSYFGKVSKSYVKIEKNNQAIINFNVSVNLFVPNIVSEKFSSIKKYRKYLRTKLLVNSYFYDKLNDEMPEGYYISKECFSINETDIESIRHLNKIYSNIRFNIVVNVSNIKLEKTKDHPELHCYAITNIFKLIDDAINELQSKSGYTIMFSPLNIGKIKIENKTNYLNTVASNVKYLQKKKEI